MESNQRLGDGNSITSREVTTDNLYYFYTKPEFSITVSYVFAHTENIIECAYVVSFQNPVTYKVINMYYLIQLCLINYKKILLYTADQC